MNRHRLLLASIACLPIAAAAQPLSGPYIDLGSGVDIRQDQQVTPYQGFGPSPRSYTFDPGAAGDLGVGYGLGNGLRFELNGNYIYSHVRGIKLPASFRAGGYEQQYGGFVDAIYDFDIGLPITPYIGGGAGYQQLELDDVNNGYYTRRIKHTIEGEAKSEFGYQGFAGFSFPLFVPGLAFTAEYRFIGMVNPNPYVRDEGVVSQTGQQYRATFSNNFNHQGLIGIRYAFGAPPAPPPPAPAPAPAVAPAPEPARTYLVFFDWDRADLTARARQIVSEAAQASTHVQTTRIEVNGYTDLSGTAAYNQRLSIRRAQSVQAELVRDGVNRNEIAIHGYGESNPLVQTAQGVREPQNRRVEIILK